MSRRASSKLLAINGGFLVAIVLALATACGSPNASVDAPPVPPAPLVPARCPASGYEMGYGSARLPVVESGSVPVDFIPTTVVVCEVEELQSTGKPNIRYLMITNTGPATHELIDSLRLPDQLFRDPDEGSCTMDIVFLPYMFLVSDQGESIRVHIPLEPCKKARPEVVASMDGLFMKETERKTVDDKYVGR